MRLRFLMQVSITKYYTTLEATTEAQAISETGVKQNGEKRRKNDMQMNGLRRNDEPMKTIAGITKQEIFPIKRRNITPVKQTLK